MDILNSDSAGRKVGSTPLSRRMPEISLKHLRNLIGYVFVALRPLIPNLDIQYCISIEFYRYVQEQPKKNQKDRNGHFPRRRILLVLSLFGLSFKLRILIITQTPCESIGAPSNSSTSAAGSPGLKQHRPTSHHPIAKHTKWSIPKGRWGTFFCLWIHKKKNRPVGQLLNPC